MERGGKPLGMNVDPPPPQLLVRRTDAEETIMSDSPVDPGCPACATGWHARCRYPSQLDDGDGELVERCCDGLLLSRRRRPFWTR